MKKSIDGMTKKECDIFGVVYIASNNAIPKETDPKLKAFLKKGLKVYSQYLPRLRAAGKKKDYLLTSTGLKFGDVKILRGSKHRWNDGKKLFVLGAEAEIDEVDGISISACDEKFDLYLCGVNQLRDK